MEKLIEMIGQDAALNEAYSHVMTHSNLFSIEQLKALRDTCGMAMLTKKQIIDAVPLVSEPVVESECTLRPKVSRLAERYWPYMRAKRVVKEIFRHYGRVNYFDAITILAQKVGITLDELYKMNPITYFERLKNRRDDRMHFIPAAKFFDLQILSELTYQLTREDRRATLNN